MHSDSQALIPDLERSQLAPSIRSKELGSQLFTGPVRPRAPEGRSWKETGTTPVRNSPTLARWEGIGVYGGSRWTWAMQSLHTMKGEPVSAKINSQTEANTPFLIDVCAAWCSKPPQM